VTAGAASSRASGRSARLLELAVVLILLLNAAVVVGVVTTVSRDYDAWTRAPQLPWHAGPMPPPPAMLGH
jgi:hypothetical protein